MIAAPKQVVVDQVESNMHEVNIKRQRQAGSSEELADAMGEASASDTRFRRIMQSTGVFGKGVAIPVEAKQVDVIEGNSSDMLDTAMNKDAFRQTLDQEMVQAAVDQAVEDEEMMQEAREELERTKAAKSAAKQAGGGVPLCPQGFS